MKKRRNDARIPEAAAAQARRNFSQAYYPGDEVFPGRFEKGGGVSKTVPDQSYSVQQLFERSRAGLTVPGKEAVFVEEDVPPFERMDFAERVAFLEDLKVYRAQIEQQFKRDDALAREKIRKEEFARQQANDKALADRIKKEVKDAG